MWIGELLKKSPGLVSVSQVDGDSDMIPSYAPLFLTLKLDNLVLPGMSLEPFELLPQHCISQ